MVQGRVEIPRQAGQYVRSRREELGLTRREAARRAGVSERLLASLELGDAPGIRLDKLLAILHTLEISLYVGIEDDVQEGDDHPLVAPQRSGPAIRRDEVDVSADTRTPYDELYRAFAHRQGIQLSDDTGAEGRE